MLCSSKQVNELLAQRPDSILLSKRHREQRKVLRSTVGIPMTDISFIINQGRVSSTLPSFIFVLHRLQLTIHIDGIRKHEDTRLRNIPEIVRGGGWERSDQHGRVWSGDPCVLGRLGFEFNRDCVYVLNVGVFVGDHVCNDTRGQPERLTALSKRNLERLDGCFHGRDINRLVVPCNIQNSALRQGKIRQDRKRTCFRHISSCPVRNNECCARISVSSRSTDAAPILNARVGDGRMKYDMMKRGRTSCSQTNTWTQARGRDRQERLLRQARVWTTQRDLSA